MKIWETHCDFLGLSLWIGPRSHWVSASGRLLEMAPAVQHTKTNVIKTTNLPVTRKYLMQMKNYKAKDEGQSVLPLFPEALRRMPLRRHIWPWGRDLPPAPGPRDLQPIPSAAWSGNLNLSQFKMMLVFTETAQMMNIPGHKLSSGFLVIVMKEAALTFGGEFITSQRRRMSLHSIKPCRHQHHIWSKLVSDRHNYRPATQWATQTFTLMNKLHCESSALMWNRWDLLSSTSGTGSFSSCSLKIKRIIKTPQHHNQRSNFG